MCVMYDLCVYVSGCVVVCLCAFVFLLSVLVCMYDYCLFMFA